MLNEPSSETLDSHFQPAIPHEATKPNSTECVIVSGIGSLIVCAITGAILATNRMGDNPVKMGIHAYLVDWAQSGNNLNCIFQTQAHAAALSVCVFLIFFSTGLAFVISRFRFPPFVGNIATFGVALFCVSGAVWWQSQPLSKLTWLVTASLFLLFATFARQIMRQSLLKKTVLVTLALVGLASVLPGLLSHYDASWMPSDQFKEFQEGYSVVSAQGDRIALGHHLFEEVKPNYGILFPVLCGLWERQHGIFSFGDNVQIIRWLQTFFVGIAFILYAWYARNRVVPLAAGFLTVLPWLHTNQISLLYPNLSAWRSFGFPLAFLILMLTTRLPATARSITLGVAAGVCLTLNLETGVAISIGLLSFLYFANHQAGRPLPLIFLIRACQLFGGLILFALVFYVTLFFSLGYWPNLQAYLQHLQALKYIMSTGYSGGYPMTYFPLAVLFFCHYTYILFRLSCSLRKLTERECFKACAATTALVWSAYYFNRPHEWYFQPQFFFYGFVLIDTIRVLQSKAWKPRAFERRAIAILATVCLLIPQVVLAYEKAWPSYKKMLQQIYASKEKQDNKELISGILVPKLTAKELIAKAHFLALENKKKQLLYFTSSTAIISKLSKCYMRANFDNPYQELALVSQTDNLVQSIKDSRVNEILLDNEGDNVGGNSSRVKCWNYLAEKLQPDFLASNNQSGWRILSRKLSSSDSGASSLHVDVVK